MTDKLTPLKTSEYFRLMSPIKPKTNDSGKVIAGSYNNIAKRIIKFISVTCLRLGYLFNAKHKHWESDKHLVKHLVSDVEMIDATKITNIKRLYREFKLRVNKNSDDMFKIKSAIDRFKKEPFEFNHLQTSTEENSSESSSIDDSSTSSDDTFAETDTSDQKVDKSILSSPVLPNKPSKNLLSLQPKEHNLEISQNLNCESPSQIRKKYLKKQVALKKMTVRAQKPIRKKSLINVLNMFNAFEPGDEWTAALKKYGPKLLDAKFLISEIKKIPDLQKQKAALKVFIKYQLISVGHNFNLGGEIALKKGKRDFLEKVKSKLFIQYSSNVKVEGWWQHFTHAKIFESFNMFVKTSSIFTSLLSREAIRDITGALKLSCLLVRDSSSKDKKLLKELFDRIKNGKVWTLAIGWSGHATGLSGKGNLIAYSNLGQRSEHMEPGIKISRLGPSRSLDETFIDYALEDLSSKKAMNFFENPDDPKGMYRLLDLHPYANIGKPDQTVGNCTWVSAQAELHALILFSILEIKVNHFKTILDNGSIESLLENVYVKDALATLKKEFSINLESLEGDGFKELLINRCKNYYFVDDEFFTPKRGTRLYTDIILDASKAYNAWALYHSNCEMTHIEELLQNLNIGHQYIEAKEVYKLKSELSREFVNTIAHEDNMIANPKEYGALFEKFQNILNLHTYLIGDCVMNLAAIDIISNDTNMLKLYLSQVLHKKLEGSFIIYKDKDFDVKHIIKLSFVHNRHLKTLQIEIIKKDDKFIYAFTIDSKQTTLNTLNDLNKTLKDVLETEVDDELLRYPVFNHNLFKEIKKLDLNRQY